MQQEQKIKEIQADAGKLSTVVKKVKIKSDKALKEASEMLLQVKARIRKIEEIRLSYTKPLNDSLKKINSDFKEASAPYQEMEKELTGHILDYRREQEQIRIAEENRLRKIEEDKAREEARKAHKSQAKAVEAVVAPVIEAKPKAVHTESGSIQARKVKRFEIVDEKKVPARFKIVDERLIRKEVLSGITEIAGVRIWEEEELSGRL